MRVVVRPARPQDAPEIVQIAAEAAAEGDAIPRRPHEVRTVAEDAEAIARHDPQEACWLVAEVDERVVGFLVGKRGQRAANRHSAEVGLSVAASHRGQGVGRALMQGFEGWARRMGVWRLALGAFAHNERGLRLYRRMGYREEGVRRAAWVLRDGRVVDEIAMAKILEDVRGS